MTLRIYTAYGTHMVITQLEIIASSLIDTQEKNNKGDNKEVEQKKDEDDQGDKGF